jgi:hypothetical protein
MSYGKALIIPQTLFYHIKGLVLIEKQIKVGSFNPGRQMMTLEKAPSR